MKKIRSFILLFFLSLLFAGFISSCKKIKYDIYDPLENYNILWTTLNDRYCYFEYKQINWDSLYYVYLPQVQATRSQTELFDVFCALMTHLQDGHVNLFSPFDVGRFWNWYLEYPRNFSLEVVNTYYLKDDYRISGGLSYTKLGSQKEIGYIRYADFSSGFSASGLTYIFNTFKDCKGLIIDVRNNGGGNLMYSDLLASRFTDKSFIAGYTLHKTGKGHGDFSTPEPQIIEPSPYLRWRKPVVVLTNRYSFSTTNDFVSVMKQIENVCLIGDQTGGGGAMPLSSKRGTAE